MSIETKPSGTKIYRNDEGKYHREDGPAVEYSNGFGLYYLNGKKVKKEEVNSLSWDIPEPKIIPTIGWNVYLNGKWIDTVFYSETDPEEVKRSLVNHDGFDPGIIVKKERRRRHSWDVDVNSLETFEKGDRVRVEIFNKSQLIDTLSDRGIFIDDHPEIYDSIIAFMGSRPLGTIIQKNLLKEETYLVNLDNFIKNFPIFEGWSQAVFEFFKDELSHVKGAVSWDLHSQTIKQSWDVSGFFSVGDIIGVKDPERFYIYTGIFEKSIKGKKLEIIRVDYIRHPEWTIEWRDGEIVVSVIDPKENYKDKVPGTFSVPVSVANEIIEIL